MESVTKVNQGDGRCPPGDEQTILGAREQQRGVRPWPKEIPRCWMCWSNINAVSLERTELDPASLILVRLAALIAVDAPVSSYLLHLGPAADVGVTLDQAQDVLVAVAPIVGTPSDGGGGRQDRRGARPGD